MTEPVEYASEEVAALYAEVMDTFAGPQTPVVEARRLVLARRMHDLLPDLPATPAARLTADE